MDKWLQREIWSKVQSIDRTSNESLLISPDWLEFLQMSPFLKQKLLNLLNCVKEQRKKTVIYPPDDRIMFWSYCCAPKDIKVVILGQDPYHGGQGTGLAFSVSYEYPIPPSLRNIFLELQRSDPLFHVPNHGCLNSWAKQGVLLLNTVLTVEKGKAYSHSELGWQWFTDYIISSLSEKLSSCVFMLWGTKAIEKSVLIDPSKHLVLKAQHPSPLAAVGQRVKTWPKFIGCDHFRQANKYLEEHQKKTIFWSIS
ncbi:orf 46 [Ateline gammaherpesvirus 3]|uniref:Orf 46 n=1 Tax=Ateline herpesvirus 3 TaxID=85618 RepID=Q9YTL9_ATHV3|nr:orf 46 [Ateline gammaherpesvirus 3]AAC95571.1 orf 46 [Ateline gammaherpesvirus 3]